MKLAHRYILFKIVKGLTILSQLAITIFFVYWCQSYISDNWNIISDKIGDFIHNQEPTALINLFLPVVYQFLIFICILILTGFTRSFAKSMSISHKHILYWIQTKEIDHLFAYRLSQHFMWNRNIGHEDFFICWKDSKYQNKILEMHQHEKDFYDYLTIYNPILKEYKPYPSTFAIKEKSIIRREDILKNKEKIEPNLSNNTNED